MAIKIKRFDKELPLPEYQTAGAAALDLIAREAVTIEPGKIGYVPLNIAIEAPAGHFFLLAARSSTHKKGLMLANGIGIVDPDYCGDGDEVKAAFLNFTNESVSVARGDRVAQGMFVSFSRAEWNEVDMMNNDTRGGFGSTGV